MIHDLQYREKRVIPLGLFELHCDDLIRSLVRRADGIINKLVARMAKDHAEANKELVLQPICTN